MPNSVDWVATTVGAVLSLDYGKGLVGESRTGTGYPVFGSSGEVGRHTQALVAGPGIVVGRKGTVGSVIWSDQPFWPIDTTYFVRRLCEVDLRWLFWRLSTLDLGALDSSTGVPGLNRNDAYRLLVRLPPDAEQHLIAAILDTLDDAISRTEQVIAKLQQMKQGLLHDLLTRGVDEHGDLRPLPEDAPHLYKDSPLGWIPKGWDAVTIGSLVRGFGGLIQTGPFGSQLHAHEYVEDGVPVVMPQDIEGEGFNESRIARISRRKAEELRRHRLQKNDAIFSRRGDLSRCASVSDNQAGWLCGTGCLLVRLPAHALDAQWLAAVYRHDRVQRQVLGRAVGSTMVNLNGAILGALFVPVPQLEEQRAVGNRVGSLTARIARENAQLLKGRTLKLGLLHDLLTGRVRVPVPTEATA